MEGRSTLPNIEGRSTFPNIVVRIVTVNCCRYNTHSDFINVSQDAR